VNEKPPVQRCAGGCFMCWEMGGASDCQRPLVLRMGLIETRRIRPQAWFPLIDARIVMRFVYVVALLLLSGSCAYVQGSAGGVIRPALFLEGEPLRSVILNPNPPRYGNGEEGGCIPSDEFRIQLTGLALDDAGRLRITGLVTNADPQRQDPVVVVVETRQGEATRHVYTAVRGHLDVTVEADEGAVLVMRLIGFRTLELDLDQLASIARRPRR
jgi:hypothetical protein